MPLTKKEREQARAIYNKVSKRDHEIMAAATEAVYRKMLKNPGLIVQLVGTTVYCKCKPHDTAK